MIFLSMAVELGTLIVAPLKPPGTAEDDRNR